MRRPAHSAVAALIAAGAFASSACARDRPDLVQMLAQSDANRDGSVTRAEFVEARRARFARMDRDHDGYVSDDDLPRIVRKRAGERLAQVTQGLDADRDGRLSRSEFVEGPARLFDLGDRDRNDRLDPEEMERLRAAVAARKAG